MRDKGWRKERGSSRLSAAFQKRRLGIYAQSKAKELPAAARLRGIYENGIRNLWVPPSIRTISSPQSCACSVSCLGRLISVKKILFLLFLNCTYVTGAVLESEKLIFFVPVDMPTTISIDLKNTTGRPLSNLEYIVDCTCLVVKESPMSLAPDVTKQVFLVLFSKNSERRLNSLLIQDKFGFKKMVKIVTYFFSNKAQLFGDVLINLTDDRPASKRVILIGDKSICSAAYYGENSNPYFQAELQSGFLIPQSNGCWQRILNIHANFSKLLGQGKSMIITYVDDGGNINSYIR